MALPAEVAPSSRDGSVWRLRLTAPDAELAERAASALEGLCQGVSAFEIGGGPTWLVEGFAVSPPQRTQLETLLLLAWAGLGEPPAPDIERLPPRDWVSENRESFPPRRVGRYFIHGTHHRAGTPAGMIDLLIDAATAFGTGEHATTSGCLIALDRLARQGRRRNVLDMGTGTGILAIAATKTWHLPASAVLAVDIDGGSVRVARENAHRNGVAAGVRVRWSTGYRSRAVRERRPYELVFANILARPLALMARDLHAALAPDGVAVLSGLLARQERFVLAAHRLYRLHLCHRIVIDGWHTLVLRRHSRRLAASPISRSPS